MRTLLAMVMIMVSTNVARADEVPEPPMAPKVPETLVAHGHERVDEYYWLRERENPDVIAYLAAENAYAEAMLAPTAALQETLFDEIVGRIEQDDASVPVLDRGYWYYTRYVEGGEYPLHCRRPETMDGPEEIMFDGNAMAAGHGFFSLRGVEVSSDGRTAAYAIDTVGRRQYTIRFRDLETGEDHAEAIANVSPGGVWAEDGRTFFYLRKDPQTLRSHQVWRHTLDTDPDRDVLVYEEADETFNLSIGKTKSREFLMIHASQTVSDEVRVLPADAPDGEWRVLQPRERNLEYSVDHMPGRWVVRTNHEAENFRLVTCPDEAGAKETWRPLVPHRDDVFLAGFQLFGDHLVLAERRDGLTRLRVRPWSGAPDHEVTFDDPTYSVRMMRVPELDTPVLRYRYSSLTTPTTVYDHDMETRERRLMKRQDVVGEFDPAWYRAEYVHATAPDGTPVPISLVYRKDRFARGSNPCLLYGYGSYGASMDASFRSWRLSLLDRGFVFAIAHVRGGQEMGRRWYEDGKLLNKKNTFTDFIACGRHLTETGHADPERLYAMGGSAGGLLMGAVMNMAPDLWHGVVAQVPFVDVVTTMLDTSIPLTTFEWDEWGDPRQKTYYEYMLSYSPYDQVARQDYPHVLVMTGLHDSQVQYWEPAKWVARLRDRKTDDDMVLLVTNMEAGHGGASGRFRAHRETAIECAFLLSLAGIER
ncbi:prolyl oligopeptidase family serine peptidase [bacterium]|nr:prolyl oligopeptidase family serine peptidase [bacterium]